MLYRLQVVLNHVTMLPRNAVNNVWHVLAPGEPSSTIDAEAIAEILREFYVSDAGPQSQALSQYIGTSITDTLHQIRVYDIDEETGESARYEGAPPLHVEPFDLLGRVAAGASLPSEVAVCLSMRNVSQVQVPAGQRRGRIYFGPLEIAGSINVVGDVPMVEGNLLQDLRLAGDALKDALEVSGYNLVVYSRPFAGRAANEKRRANGTFLPPLPAREGHAYNVEQFVTDNAFDTQRRRGEKATARTVL